MERRCYIRTRILSVSATMIAFCALVTPLPALAAQPNLPGASSIQQYIESIPTTSGSQQAGVGGEKTRIPRSIKRRIAQKAGSNASLLEHVVASQAYGAPPTFRAQTTPAPATRHVEHPAGGTNPNQRSRPAGPAPIPRAPTSHVPAARAVLPPAPGAASTALGSFGGPGVLFLLALTAAIAAVPLARLLGISPRSGSEAASSR